MKKSRFTRGLVAVVASALIVGGAPVASAVPEPVPGNTIQIPGLPVPIPVPFEVPDFLRAPADGSNAPRPALTEAPLPELPPAPAPAPEPAPEPPAPPAPEPWRAKQPVPVAAGANGAVRIPTAFGERRFLIYVPAGYTPEREWPVMVGIPAYQDTSENYRNYSKLRESTIGREAIIVYPDSWRQSWEGAPTSSSAPGQDIEFIRQVIDRVGESYNIDRARLYATGMSTGSGMAALLGCQASDLFAAVAPVSGAYYDAIDQNCQNNPMAIMTVHGTIDEQHAYDGGYRYGLHYYGGRELMERYAARNGCGPERTESPLPGGAVKVVAQGCRAATEHIRVNGGTHFWWYVPDTAEEVWKFVSAQRRF